MLALAFVFTGATRGFKVNFLCGLQCQNGWTALLRVYFAANLFTGSNSTLRNIPSEFKNCCILKTIRKLVKYIWIVSSVLFVGCDGCQSDLQGAESEPGKWTADGWLWTLDQQCMSHETRHFCAKPHIQSRWLLNYLNKFTLLWYIFSAGAYVGCCYNFEIFFT